MEILPTFLEFVVKIQNMEKLADHFWLILIEYQCYEELFLNENLVEYISQERESGLSFMEEGLTSIQKFLETNKSDLDGSDKLFLAKKKKRVDKYLDFSIVEYEVPTPSQGAVFVSAISALSNLTKSIF